MPKLHPANEEKRLQALHRYHILDTAPEEHYDDITRLASYICSTPVAFISLVDTARQWFKSKMGIDATETSREIAFCSHTILGRDMLVVADALQDERFAHGPLTTLPPHIRFYAGMPLVTPDGHSVGALCVVDREPRTLRAEQSTALRSLARQVVQLLELRRVSAELAEALAAVRTLRGLLPICAYCKRVRDDAGYWSELEAYIRTATDSEFTHGICPACAAKYFTVPDGSLSTGDHATQG
jgi:GAF domain-containing protein